MSTKKGPNGNGDAFPLQTGKPRAADPTSDFARALEAANTTEAPEVVGLPAIFPGSLDKIQDKEEPEAHEHEEVPLPKEQGMPSMVKAGAKDFIAKYRRFNLDDPLDVQELEKINNHIMQDGWLPGREEWIHTRDGGTYVVLKWLERTTPLKKPKSPEDDATDEILKDFGMERG